MEENKKLKKRIQELEGELSIINDLITKLRDANF